MCALPYTGMDLFPISMFGLVLLSAGGGLLLATRRRV